MNRAYSIASRPLMDAAPTDAKSPEDAGESLQGRTRSPRSQPPAGSFLWERTFSKIDASGDCWEWTASLTAAGYGQINIGNLNGQARVKTAHRVVWELLVGPIPTGMHIDHLCRNRRCVNPAHLEVVTPAVNAYRAVGKNTRIRHGRPCRKGHPGTPENIYVRPGDGSRRCLPCHREESRAQKRRAA